MENNRRQRYAAWNGTALDLPPTTPAATYPEYSWRGARNVAAALPPARTPLHQFSSPPAISSVSFLLSALPAFSFSSPLLLLLLPARLPPASPCPNLFLCSVEADGNRQREHVKTPRARLCNWTRAAWLRRGMRLPRIAVTVFLVYAFYLNGLVERAGCGCLLSPLPPYLAVVWQRDGHIRDGCVTSHHLVFRAFCLSMLPNALDGACLTSYHGPYTRSPRLHAYVSADCTSSLFNST